MNKLFFSLGFLMLAFACSGQVTNMGAFRTPFFYNQNFGSSFIARSMPDKRYVDSCDSARGGGGSSYYQTIQSNASSQTQRAKLNFSTDFTLADNSGNGSTDVSISTSKVNSGIYFPTLTDILGNTSALTSDSAVWSRTGNTVTVSGKIVPTPNANNALVEIDVSLPIASLLNGGHACWGTGAANAGATANDIVILGDGTNHKSILTFTSGASVSGTPIGIIYTYQYQIQ